MDAAPIIVIWLYHTVDSISGDKMISSDSPITDPKDDQFGIDNFAKAIAKAIDRLAMPDGTVIALTGPWGSARAAP